MKPFLNIVLLIAWIALQVIATVSLGGAAPEYALPMYGAAMLLAGIWALKLFFCRPVSWIWSPMHIPVAGFVVYAAIRYAFSPLEYASRMELVQVTMYALIYFTVAANLHRPRDRFAVLVALVALAFGQSFYGLWQKMSDHSVVFGWDRSVYQGRASGTFFCPNHLAGFLVMVLGLLIARIVVQRPDRKSMEKLALQKLPELYLAGFLAIGLWATLSRGGWVSLIVAILFFLFWARRTGALSRKVVIAACCVFAAVAVIAGTQFSVRNRFAQTVLLNWQRNQKQPTVLLAGAPLAGREFMWKSTSRMIQDYPLWGTAPGTWQWFYPLYRHPSLQGSPQFAHNDALQLAAEYGGMGVFIVLAGLGCFFWQTTRIAASQRPSDERAMALGSATAMVGILIHSLGDFNLHIPANALLAATLLGLVAAMGDDRRHTRQEDIRTSFRFLLATVMLLAGLTVGWLGIRNSMVQRTLLKAEDAKQLHQWDNAIAGCEHAIALDPRSPDAYAQLGDVRRFQTMNLPEYAPDADAQRLAHASISAYQHSLDLNPYQIDLLLQMAVSFELANDLTNALASYQLAISLDPNNGFAQFRLGLFHLRNQDKVQAREAFARAAELNPRDPTLESYLKQLPLNSSLDAPKQTP